jgi:hypothetical protein
MRLTELIRAFAQAEEANPSHHELLYTLQRVALDVVYAENARGGEARGVVADVARILGTDIDAGPGHRWDADHMRRVVTSAQAMKAERNIAIRDCEDHREYARRMEQERDALREAHAKAAGDAAYWRHSWEQDKGPDVDDLKATIVSQAREIARLKGESA